MRIWWRRRSTVSEDRFFIVIIVNFSLEGGKKCPKRKKQCPHPCSKLCHSGVCETSVCIKLISVTCPCREKKSEKRPCHEVVELRKKKQLAHDSNAVLECDQVCIERQKERALQKQKEEEEEEERLKTARKRNKNQKGEKSAAVSAVSAGKKSEWPLSSEIMIYVGAFVASLFLVLFLYISKKYAV